MKNNFLKLEQTTQEIPNVKKGYLNDIAKKILNHTKMSEDDISNLEIIYTYLQKLDLDLVCFFDKHRINETINKIDFLFVVNYFLIEKQNKILNENFSLYDNFSNLNLNVYEMKDKINLTKIPLDTKKYLLKIYFKILKKQSLKTK